MIIYYGQRIYSLDSSKNNTFSQNSVDFMIDGADSIDFSGIDMADIFKINTSAPFSAYEVICTNGRLNIAGGIDIDKDFVGTNKAVIGSEVNTFVSINPLKINNKAYEISQTFTDNLISSNNCTVFYSGNSDCMTLNSKFIIDGQNKSEIESALKSVTDLVEKNGGTVTKLESNKVGISSFVKYRGMLIVISVIYIFVLVFTNMMICIFRLESLKREMSVYILLGRTNIFTKMFSDLTIKIIISSIINLPFLYILTKQFYKSCTSILIADVMIGIINILVCAYFAGKCRKSNFNILMEIENE